MHVEVELTFDNSSVNFIRIEFSPKALAYRQKLPLPFSFSFYTFVIKMTLKCTEIDA